MIDSVWIASGKSCDSRNDDSLGFTHSLRHPSARDGAREKKPTSNKGGGNNICVDLPLTARFYFIPLFLCGGEFIIK